ncbi:MAG TPA: efflux RND transporter permease subunit [Bacteroidota bacterium]|nr:efflux RND transporter permease subunit [Bacteroidota bacterium]
MRISNLAVDNRVAVYILIAIIVIVGWNSYSELPREAAPDITIPLVIVSTPYVGVAPSDVEGLVTQPLERNLKSLKDIKQITSASKEGLSTVRVEFTVGVDIDEALRRVRDEVNSTRPELPSDVLDPVVSEINFSEFPIMYVNVGGNFGIARLKKIAENLQDKFEAIPGVLRADLNGGLEPEVQVNCDVTLLNGYKISFDDLVNAIKGENVSIPGGSIDNETTNFSVRVPGEYKQVGPIEGIIVKLQNGKPIYVRDVASVEYSFEDRLTYARLNDEEVVTLAVRKRAGENLVRIAGEVKKIVNETRPALPPGVTLTISNDQSITIARMVGELENSIMTGMFLVVVLLFMFFGFKNSLLISTAIPLSMFIGFIILGLVGITLNFVVLFGLVLVLGILVDDAIVVIENIYRHQQTYDKDPIHAAKDGTAEVSVPIITSTVTTLAAFVPLLFWPGVVGDFMKYLPLTLIYTLGASLFVAFVISPVQGAQWINYKKEIRKAKENLEHPHWYKRYNPITIIYHKVDERFFPWAQETYAGTLRWALQRKGTTILASMGVLVLITALFGLLNKGIVFFPNTQPNMANVTIEAPSGTSLEVTNKIAHELEERFRNVPGKNDMEFVVTSVGTSDNPFDFGGQGTSNKGQIAVNFFEKSKRKQSSFQTIDEIRNHSTGIPGADIKVSKQAMGPPVGAPVSIEIAGEDYAQLAALSSRIQGQIKQISNLVDVKDDYNAGKPEIEVEVDREKAALLWMNTDQVANTVRSAINGTEASKYRLGEDEYKIRVRLQGNQRSSPADLENLMITFMNKQGKLVSVPLVSVATIRKTAGLADIQRKDQKRVITITGDVQGRLASEVLQDVKSSLAQFDLPGGYTIKYSGEDEEQQKAAAFLTQALVITLLMVFLILVMEFNSIKVPFVIMLSVPLSLVGVFIGLLATLTPFSIIMTGIGVIALSGIVVKNAIVLLDFMKHLRESGLTLDEALVEAGRTRLRPVLLTAATTVLGILPLATGFDFDWRKFHFVIGAESADFWRPLGISIISGLTVSTFLTLVVIPTFYSLFESWGIALKGRLRDVRNRLGSITSKGPATSASGAGTGSET